MSTKGVGWSTAKTYLVVFGALGLAAALFIGVMAVWSGAEERGRAEVIEKARLKQAARWDAMSPEEKAAELAARDSAALRAREEQAAKEDAKWLQDFPTAARGACLIALQQSLNDPYSAKFDRTTSWYVAPQESGTWRVQPKLRAKNGFGAYVYATYDCIVEDVRPNVRVASLKRLQ